MQGNFLAEVVGYRVRIKGLFPVSNGHMLIIDAFFANLSLGLFN